MIEFIRYMSSLHDAIYCFGEYVPPKNPFVNYFPQANKKDLPEFVGMWDDIKTQEYKVFDNKTDKLLYHLIWKKGKDGYIYLWDKLKKKKWTDNKFTFKCLDNDFVFKEGSKWQIHKI